MRMPVRSRQIAFIVLILCVFSACRQAPTEGDSLSRKLAGHGDPGGAGPRALAAGQGLAGRHLVFVMAYRVRRNSLANVFLRMGHYDFEAGGRVAIRYFLYDGNANRGSVSNAYHTPMAAAPRGGCGPGRIYTPGYSSYESHEGSWRPEGDRLLVTIGNVVHEWALHEPQEGFYRLSRDLRRADAAPGEPPWSAQTIGGWLYSGGIGFGYVTDFTTSSPFARMDRELLHDRYRAEVYQIDGRGSAKSPWTYHNEINLAPGAFTLTSPDPDVVGYTHGNCGTDKVPDMLCHYSMLFNASPYTNLMFHLNGGHDYNDNHCMDEYNHRYVFFGIPELDRATGKLMIGKLVGLEYSWEHDSWSDAPPFPLISLGRYHSPYRMPGN